MKRKDFIALVGGSLGLAMVAGACRKPHAIGGKMVGASAELGHLIRDGGDRPVDGKVSKKKIVIVGAGISGLSAARWLSMSGEQDYLLLDLEPHPGGNSASGSNDISAYPWGAHYVPIPNNDLTEYLAFLQSHDIIKGYSEHGLPVYNEWHLCFDPDERLYINGRWQEGLVPHYGIDKKELLEIQRFLAEMDSFRNALGTDKKQAFAIPVSNSSADEVFRDLDKLSMKTWMEGKGYKSSSLHHYVNYCTRDDFGATHATCSAWAGIHYFASRKGKAENAHHSDVLTWPEGNGHLVNCLVRDIKGTVQTGSMVLRVSAVDTGVHIDYYDTATKKVNRIESMKCILAVPQFVAARILRDDQRKELVNKYCQYAPWMVANLRTNGPLQERSGAPLSWDNVIFNRESLGYIDATHQQARATHQQRNLTYYLPLTAGKPPEERSRARSMTHEQWVNHIIDDLKLVHPDIEKKIDTIDIMVWGHAMITPSVGYISSAERHAMGAPLNDRIYFAHTDLAGISIFEEAFYQGIDAAKQILDEA